jgi:predicted ArsR family transcriptional regulator
MSDETVPENTLPSPVDEARSQWREERTTFQRVYDVITGTTDHISAKVISERADCSTDGARAALSQLVEMGIVEQRGGRPAEYRRNESYFRWKRVDTLAREHSVADLREQVEALLDEDQVFQERFDAPDPDTVSPAMFESVNHDTVHERWEALTRWRSVREDLKVLQQAVHRAERDTEGCTETSASA